MRARHPTLWLMTDERADALAAARRLPPGAGIVFRHRATPSRARYALYLRLRRIARARGLVIVTAGGRLPGAAGRHGPGVGGDLVTWPAHDRRQALAAVRAGAAVLFVSPVYPTRSHPGAAALGPVRAARIARGLGVGVIALGGMDAARWREVRGLGFSGWAAIDGLAASRLTSRVRPPLRSGPGT